MTRQRDVPYASDCKLSLAARPDSAEWLIDAVILVAPAEGREARIATLSGLPEALPDVALIESPVRAEAPDVNDLNRRAFMNVASLNVRWAERGTVLQPGCIDVCPPRGIRKIRPGGPRPTTR